MLTLAAFAFAGTLMTPAPARQDPPLNFDQSISCAAAFHGQSRLVDGDLKGALTRATAIMTGKARALRPDLAEAEIVRRVEAEAQQVIRAMAEANGAEAVAGVLMNWGPGRETCLDAAMS